jgi:hypothetical protein
VRVSTEVHGEERTGHNLEQVELSAMMAFTLAATMSALIETHTS